MTDPIHDLAPGAASHSDVPGALLIDVRRAAAFASSDAMLPGARWRDPAAVEHWAAELRAGQPIVVYCVHGHEVSQTAAQQLRAAGLDARYLQGGITGWQAAGQPVVNKGDPA